MPRFTWIGATALVVSLSAAMVRDRLPPAMAAPHWDRYLALSLRASGQSIWTSEGEKIASDNPNLNERLFEHLTAALECEPHNARVNLRMAVSCLRLFDIRQQNSENAMSLTQIRDAALASKFASRQEQDQWLSAAIGENRKYLDLAARCLRRSLRLCPVQGEAYVYLAETAFLDGLGAKAKHEYIVQAEKLRPYHGVVLMAVGQEAALDGNLDRAMESWKLAFHQDPESQQRVVELLAGGVTAEQFLEYFEPDQRGLARLFGRYRFLNRTEDVAACGKQYAPLLEEQARQVKGADAGRLWMAAANVYSVIGDSERALVCSEQAARAAPGNIVIRRSYGFRLLDATRYDEAMAEFQWCLRYNPDDESSQAGLARARRRGLTTPPVAGKPEGAKTRF